MRLKATWSIRRRVLALLLLAMALVFSANLLGSYFSNLKAADSAYDRLLLASASAIAERVAMRGDGVSVDIPYAALNMLASPAQNRVFYAVSGQNGKVVTGYRDLPSAPRTARRKERQEPLFYNSIYKGVPVRIVELRSFLSGKNQSGFATVLVAQTRGDRDGLAHSLLQRSALVMLIITLVGATVTWVGVGVGLRPLARLCEALDRRSPDDTRLLLHDVPVEFKPLMDAINAMLGRIDHGLRSMRDFIGHASHHLKSPLASLQVQSEMALRETDHEALREALIKVNQSVRRTSRLAQQLLSHAQATEASQAFVEFDLTKLVHEIIAVLLPQARDKNIDLGYDGADRVILSGARALIGELVLNLTDNAIKYSARGAVVTVHIGGGDDFVRLIVEDNGPGIPEALRRDAFERFVRLESSDKTATEGCGLGLAIVREIADYHRAGVVLKNTPGGGLWVEVDFPASGTGNA